MKLSSENFLYYALAHYTNTNITDIEEFNDDLKRFKYIKKLLNRYKTKEDIQIHLVVNHMVILYNVFTPIECTKMLVFKLHEHVTVLKPILSFLDRWPKKVDGIEGLRSFKGSEIISDPYIKELLDKRYKRVG